MQHEIQLEAPAGTSTRVAAVGARLQVLELLSWEAKQRPPVELELIVYPTWEPEITAPASNVPAALMWWALKWSHGAPQAALPGLAPSTAGNSQAHETSFLSGAIAGAPFPFTALPVNGLRMRFAATWAKLYFLNLLPSEVRIHASMQPVLDSSAGTVLPPAAYPISPLAGSPLVQHPIGAREWRVLGNDPTMSIEQCSPNGTTVRTDTAASISDWTPIDLNLSQWRILAADFTAGDRCSAIYR